LSVRVVNEFLRERQLRPTRARVLPEVGL
jgi:hypothetical protein